MKGGKYAKTLAEIKIRGIFRIRDIGRNVLPKLTQLFLESGIHCAGIRNPVPGIRNPQHGIQNPRLSWIPLHGAI